MKDTRIASLLSPGTARPRGARSVAARRIGRAALGLSLGLAFGTLAACGGSSSSSNQSSQPAGSLVTHPDPQFAGETFFVDTNAGGKATQIRIAGIFWGRLVDVHEVEPTTGGAGELKFQDLMIGDDIRSNGIDYLLTRNPVTAREQLVILHAEGTPEYDAAVGKLEQNLQPILNKGLDPSELPPFTAVPRNAAMMVRFTDLIDPSTVDESTIRLAVGNPPNTPFEPRLLIDRNHGDLADLDGQPGAEFYTTRVILDTTLSELEAQTTGQPVNALGLPAAITVSQANVGLRIPTQENAVFNQFQVLRNPTGHTLTFTNNGATDPHSQTQDIVRGFRSGGDTSITGDPTNGFLFDNIAPQIIGVQPVTVTSVVPSVGVNEFDVSLTFGAAPCASGAIAGDVIELPGLFAEVVLPKQLSGGSPVLNGLRVRVIAGDPAGFGPGVGQFLSAFDSSIDIPECFARFSPAALQPPAAGIDPNAVLTVRFSEPVDPSTVQAFDTFKVDRAADPNRYVLENVVPGSVVPSSDLVEFSFVPALPYTHLAGAAEQYDFSVLDGATGIRDLAGNALAESTGVTSFAMSTVAPTATTGGQVLLMDAVDMDLDGLSDPAASPPVGYPELRGNFLYNITRGVIQPRPMSRFAATADGNVPIVGAMVPFTFPIQTPLSNLGSKLQMVWRYTDVGFSLLDETTYDLDVEGLNWAPFGNQVQIDNYDNFRISLAHSRWLPDEVISTTSLLPTAPQSGLVKGFDNNLLDAAEDPLTMVHDTALGYTVEPIDLFTASTGTGLMPWPLNRNKPVSEFEYWVWRDTTKTALGAPNGNGADPARLAQITGVGATEYQANAVPTVGLPLLMEFRCYPDDGAFGLNGFTIALAINSSARPNFRAFSTGGIDTGGVPQKVDPDNEITATGGYNPTSTPPGQTTPGSDNSFYFGQADFAVRTSRVISIWFDVGAGLTADFVDPILEPIAQNQPFGTQVILEYRGASDVNGTPDCLADADQLNAYGDDGDTATFPGCGGAPVFLNGDSSWKSSIHEIDGARFYQFRITFISNSETGLTPEVSALGFPYFLN